MRLTKEQQTERRQLAQDLDHVLRDEQGRRFVLRLLETSAVFDSVWSVDSATNNFKQGDQRAGLRLYLLIEEHCPTALLEIHRMRIARNQKAEIENERSTGNDDD